MRELKIFALSVAHRVMSVVSMVLGNDSVLKFMH